MAGGGEAAAGGASAAGEVEGWTHQAVVMSLLLPAMVVTLISDKVGPDFVMSGGIAIALATGVLTVPEALAGFANEGLLTVVALFVVAAGINKTGGLDWYMSKLLGSPKSATSAQLRLTLPVACVSAFLNNTPVVAVMIPIVQRWAETNHIDPGQLMIPLSFASSLGGTCTLIGTSTNLVVEGMLKQRYGWDKGLSLFSLSWFGIPVAICGLAYMLAAAPLLLPGGALQTRKGQGAARRRQKEQLVGLRVPPGSGVVGQSVRESRLQKYPGVYLVRVQRAGQDVRVKELNTHGLEVVLGEGDIIWFAGQSDAAKMLSERLRAICRDHDLEMLDRAAEAPLSRSPSTAEPGGPAPEDAAATAAAESCIEEENEGEEERNEAEDEEETTGMMQSPPDSPRGSGRSLGRRFRACLASASPFQVDMLTRTAYSATKPEEDEEEFEEDEAPDRVHDREFLTAMRVKLRSPMVGKAAASAGLGKLPGLYLVAHERHAGAATAPYSRPQGGMRRGLGSFGSLISALSEKASAACPPTEEDPEAPDAEEEDEEDKEVTQSEVLLAQPKVPQILTLPPGHDVLRPGDVLWFEGSATAISELRKVPGLEPLEKDEVSKIAAPLHSRRLVRAAVARTGPLVGKCIRHVRFREVFGAVVVAVHREHSRVHERRVGDVVLQAGDILLLEAGPQFLQPKLQNPDIPRAFSLVAQVENSAPPRLKLLVPALACCVLMIAVYTAGVCPLLVAAMFAAAAMISTGCLSQQEARDAVKWDVYVCIAMAFGISQALSNSGLAAVWATHLVRLGGAAPDFCGHAGLYTAVYVATMLVSNVVTNNAAAALVFPIAADAAEQAGIDPMPMAFLLMLGASSTFMSPFAYQTNLMVVGPGGYKFGDFVRFGFPMSCLQLVVSVMIISIGSSAPSASSPAAPAASTTLSP